MSLLVLVALVVIGVGLVVLLVHVTGNTATQRFVSANPSAHDESASRQLLDEFGRTFPGLQVRTLSFEPEGRVALLALRDGGDALAVRLGDKTVFRRFDRAHQVARLAGNEITVDVGDLAFPRQRLRYPSDAEARTAFDIHFKPEAAH